MDIKQVFIRFARFFAKRIPGGKKLAQKVYQSLPSERWTTAYGMPWLINIHQSIGCHLFISGKYCSARIAEIQAVVKTGDTVVDIGANVGYFTLLFAKLVGKEGKVYSFEPDPRNFQLLQRTLERNGLTQVKAVQKAVSDKADEFLLYQTASWAANTLTSSEHVSTVSVQVVALDEFLSDESNISFIKMDMDGSEPLAIQGMTQLIRRSPNLTVLAEYEPGNLKRYIPNPLDFITIAEQHGLKLTAILDSESGRFSDLDLSPLRNLADDRNLDLLFTRSSLE